MSRAEVKAWEYCLNNKLDPYSMGHAYVDGYEQAEKDIIGIIETRISEIMGDAQPNSILRIELRELIKKIKDENY